ncbi:monosaccharide ABC transporter substrate-binding protein, CUT2 family [Psychromonas ingrahamii 37]|uniref:Monosaccharide ABC transporter substrate-binding protein, CUT2 family n=1 Tax=Psychromonas ingrahamii (strain DSM 17664 / CCUG 51855 / 37) TaxID=357804 RepID=A1SYE8_PSYIN|nr:ABC transporter substrate-binding protein [Psychromonas ingrahamii]ABM04513.1 monosaccharide ABC transporter substrate-binding protein, CUT2 family [Psychromonas ingrahamii 37]
MKGLKYLAMTGVLFAGISTSSYAGELNKIGVSLGSMGNPFFVALASGAEAEAKKINPNVEVLALGYDYDLGKQFNQIDNFIAAGVDLILLNPGDPNAIEPAIKRAQKAGIVVVSVDTAAKGSDATVTTDNVSAGAVACQYIVEKLEGKGNVIIQNGPQVSAVIDRVNGCKEVLKAAPGITILSDDQDGKGSRDGGMSVMLGHLTRFSEIDAVFAINDPQAIGADLAAKQLKRDNIIITSVDGAPGIVAALKNPDSPMIQASGSQNPFVMASKAVELGYQIMNGEVPEESVILLPSELVTRDNVNEYKGWDAVR